MTESGIEARVNPAMVPKHSAIAEVSGVTNAVAHRCRLRRQLAARRARAPAPTPPLPRSRATSSISRAGLSIAAVRRADRQAEALQARQARAAPGRLLRSASPSSTGPASWPRSPSAWATARSRSKASSNASRAWRRRAQQATRRSYHARDNRGSDPTSFRSHRERRQSRRASTDMIKNRKVVIGDAAG